MGWAIGIIVAIACGALYVIRRPGGRQATGAFRNRPTSERTVVKVETEEEEESSS